MLVPRHSLLVQAGLMLALVTEIAYAGWNTNVWPPQTYPRNVKGALMCAWSATVERCRATDVALPDSPTWMRSTRGNLIEIKSHLRIAASNFLQHSLADGDGRYETYMRANTNRLPWTVITQMLVAAGLPTNYFDYTPVRDLNGIGGFTNPPDTSYAWPYGYTNSYTTNGGASYPGTRVRWYTTDYGIAGISNIASQLVWTRGVCALSASTGKYGHCEATDTWAHAQADTEAAFTDPLEDDNGPACYTFGVHNYPVNVKYWAEGYNAYGHVYVTNLWTGLWHTVDFYLAAYPNDFETNLLYDTLPWEEYLFNDNGVADIATAMTYKTTSADTNLVSLIYFSVGDAASAFPVWCSEPDPSEDFVSDRYAGWEINVDSYLSGGVRVWYNNPWTGPRAVVKWDRSTNGFQWK